jgi:hypothetical protein
MKWGSCFVSFSLLFLPLTQSLTSSKATYLAPSSMQCGGDEFSYFILFIYSFIFKFIIANDSACT